MRKKKIKKLTACLLTFALALTTAGCGSKEEQKTTAESTETKETETNDSEAIGSGTDMNTDLDAEEMEKDVESSEKEELKDFQFINQWITAIGDDNTELYLKIGHHLEETKRVEFSYEDVLLDGVSAESWDAQGYGGANTVTTKPAMWFPQTLTLNTNIDNYSELTIEATANFDDGTEPYPFSVTYQISELERKIDESSKVSFVHIEEQELYNENGIIVTIPEQKQEFSAYTELELHFESSIDHEMYVSFLNVMINGELIAEGRISNADTTLSLGESNSSLYLGDSIDSDIESGKITFVLFITEDQRNPFAEPEITIPYTVIKE